MNKICHINQPWGLGDILICEPIARYYYNQGYEIIYWVKDEYLWIQNYIKYINFKSTHDNYINHSDTIINDNYVYLPLINKRVSDTEGWWLYDKYTISKVEYEKWIDFNYERNYQKETELFNKLNLLGKDYILINEYSSMGSRNLNINSNYEIIKMKEIEGYTMLDWCKVMENAKEVHTVSTSILFPLLKMRHNSIFIYNRYQKGVGSMGDIKVHFDLFNLNIIYEH